jgi:LmbE family N-acetylglucosaminyl deacetylase
MAPVATRLIAPQGTPEHIWAPLLQRLPLRTLDSLVRADAHLLVVAPHPDDEVLACGGLLFEHALRGGRCTVVAVTDGEASHGDTSTWSPAALAAQRRQESALGLRSLGLTGVRVVRLGLPDGQVREHQAALRTSLTSLLHAGDVVVTTWRLDGHPDHEAVGDAVEAACAAARAKCLQAPVWMWHWSWAADTTVPWDRLEGLALTPAARACKRAALAAHTTQLSPRSTQLGPVLDDLILARAERLAEYFFI